LSDSNEIDIKDEVVQKVIKSADNCLNVFNEDVARVGVTEFEIDHDQLKTRLELIQEPSCYPLLRLQTYPLIETEDILGESTKLVRGMEYLLKQKVYAKYVGVVVTPSGAGGVYRPDILLFGYEFH